MYTLIVNDQEDLRLLLERVLADAGIRSVHATGGREALATLAESDELPAVVLLDVQMQVLDGWETLRAIRSMPFTRHLPVIMCNERSSDVDAARGRKFGANGYISKPFDLRELVAAVRVFASSRTGTPQVRTRSHRSGPTAPVPPRLR